MRGRWCRRFGAIASVGGGFEGRIFDLVGVGGGRDCGGGRRGFVGTGGDRRYIGGGWAHSGRVYGCVYGGG
jgi:hypothetical protein